MLNNLILLQTSLIPIWVYDLETFFILDVNESAVLQYGYSAEEFKSLTIYDLSAPTEFEKLNDALHELNSENEKLYKEVFTHVKKNGEPIMVQISAQDIFYEGKISRLVAAYDVTEKELLQERLIHAQSLAKVGYWQLNTNGLFKYCTPEVFNIWGRSKENFPTDLESFFATIHPAEKSHFASHYDKFILFGEALNFKHRILLPDGKHKWVEQIGNCVRNENNKILYYEGTVQDITANKSLEISLEESNKRYDYATKATFDAIWDWNIIEGTIVYGDVLETLFGYSPAEMKSSANFLTDFIHPDDRDRILKSIHKALEDVTVSNWVEEYRYLKKDQTYAFIIDKAYIIRGSKGRAKRMIGSMRDISDKKALEDLLEKSNRMARIGSWEIDVKSNLIFWSDVTKEIHEVPQESSFISVEAGREFYKEGSSRDLIVEKMKESRSSGSSWDLELELITAKGNQKWVRVMADTDFTNGQCSRIYGNIQDITERKLYELKLKEVLEENVTILESIGDAFIAVDKSWIITYWNSMAEKMIGVSRNEVIGLNLWTYFNDSLESISYQKYHEAMSTQVPIYFEDFYPPRWYEIKAFPSKKGLSIYFHDISQRKNIEIELNTLNDQLNQKALDLQLANQELEQFAYVASHDLQEPLRMVKSFLTIIQAKYSSVVDEKGKKYIDFAVDGATRMETLIKDLLQYTLTVTSSEMEWVDLNELIEVVLSLIRKSSEDKNAIIQVENLPVLKINRIGIFQVFLNLITNGLKYQAAGSQPVIKVRATEKESDWLFLVSDNGIGISENNLDKVFIIFKRLHNRSEYSGSGLGLAICKKIVERNGGEIWVESQEGVGSNFYFSIPKR